MSLQTILLRCKWSRSILCALLLLLVTQGFLSAQPPSPSEPRDALVFRDAETFLTKGEPEKALWRFRRFLNDFPTSSLVNEAKFRMGICYTQLKRPKDAIRMLTELLPTFLAPGRMVQVFTLLGDNYLELKDPLSAVYWYGKGLLVPKQPNDDLKKKIRSIVDAVDSEEKLREIESIYRGAYGGGYAKLKLAQMAKRRGDDLQAKRILSEMEKEYQAMDYWPQTRELLEPARPVGKATYTLGVILPLSGIYQSFGEKTLQGIQLALKEIESPAKSPLVSLVVRDSKGIPAEAEKAVEELVTKEKVIGIIGPLLSLTAEKAGIKAQELKVPMITLSPKELPNQKGGFVFQNSVSYSAQVETLVAFAIGELELRTFGIFYPNSPYGLYFKNLFQQEVNRKGGRVVGVVAYQEDQTDFSQEIRAFLRIKAVQRNEPDRKSQEEFTTGLPIDGLFIPDAYDRVGLILNQMGYLNMKGVTFLGTNGWNNPGLISIAKKSAEGAVFVDAFSKTKPDEATSHFLGQFRKTYLRDPETLEALGYETADLFIEILRSNSVSSPVQLKEAIRQVINFQGVCGLNGFGEEGKTIRTLSILRVKNGQIVHFSP